MEVGLGLSSCNDEISAATGQGTGAATTQWEGHVLCSAGGTECFSEMEIVTHCVMDIVIPYFLYPWQWRL